MATLSDKSRAVRASMRLTVLLAVALMLPLVAGCSNGTPGQGGTEATSGAGVPATSPAGAAMAGPVQKVVVSKQAIAAKPAPWDLSSPESAVRSYLDWTAYAYRITESSVATPTMSAEQEVRVDSYVQLNLQQSRILDEALASITFGKSRTVGKKVLLPATERWSYRYVSISEVGKTLSGPYTVSYETTYTLMKSQSDWVVDSIAVKALGEVK